MTSPKSPKSTPLVYQKVAGCYHFNTDMILPVPEYDSILVVRVYNDKVSQSVSK